MITALSRQRTYAVCASGANADTYLVGDNGPAYSWRRQRWLQTVRLTGNNLLDKFFVGPESTVGLGRQINFTYTLSLR